MMPVLRPHNSANEERLHFARQLIALLRERDWNQSDLSRRTGLSRDSISTYARGRSMPEPANLRKIAEALGVTTERFQLPVMRDPKMMALESLHSIERELAGAAEASASAASIAMLPGGQARIRIDATLPLDKALLILKAAHDAGISDAA
jgi:transcriptional regulator with XRE-family HTH domain